MKIAVVGSRKLIVSPRAIKNVMNKLWLPNEYGHQIISGGAKGIDACAKECANEFNLGYTEFPAEWDKYGKTAGFKRNQQIVDSSEATLAFWDAESNGTLDTIRKTRDARHPCVIIVMKGM